MKELYAIGAFNACTGEFIDYVCSGRNYTPAVYSSLVSAKREVSRCVNRSRQQYDYRIISLSWEKVLDK